VFDRGEPWPIEIRIILRVILDKDKLYISIRELLRHSNPRINIKGEILKIKNQPIYIASSCRSHMNLIKSEFREFTCFFCAFS